MDLEPVHTMRGHCGAVLSLAMSRAGEFCYSGGIDGTICCWNLPNICVDPYDAYGRLPQRGVLLSQFYLLTSTEDKFDNVQLFVSDYYGFCLHFVLVWEWP